MTSWSQKRPGAGKFTPENIDSSLCTHIIYAFATLKDHKLVEGEDKDDTKDADKESERYKQVVALRDKNPNLKVSVTWPLIINQIVIVYNLNYLEIVALPPFMSILIYSSRSI